MSSTTDTAINQSSDLQTEKDNLQNDIELISHINPDMTIPVSAVISRLSNISTDENAIISMLEKCRLCDLVNNNTIVKVKLERRTVILREVSENATEEQIRSLFTDPSCGVVELVEKEVANSWFVTFDTEEHARSAALQAMKKEIDGKKVHARLRTETLVLNTPSAYIPPAPTTTTILQPPPTTSSLSPSNPSLSTGNEENMENYYYNNYNFYGYDMNNIPLEGLDATSFLPENLRKNNNNNYRSNNNNRSGGGGGGMRKDGRGNDRNGKGGRGNSNNGRRGGNDRNNRGRRSDISNNNSGRYRDDWRSRPFTSTSSSSGRIYNNNNNNNNNNNMTGVNNNNNISSDPLNFPPLAMDDVDSGYHEPYISYTEDEIISIVKNYTNFSLPNSLEKGDHSAAIGKTPNGNLVKNQRSMSIDQALEHGRPFRFASVDSTDYNVMLFGGDLSESDRLSSPSIKPISSKSIPPPISNNPKGYAAVVKNGKPEVQQQQQPPPPSSSSATTATSSQSGGITSSAPTNSGHSESSNKRSNQRRKSKDKKDKTKKGGSGNGNNINWTYHSSQDKSSKENGNSWAAIVTKPKNEVPPPAASTKSPAKSEEPPKADLPDNKTVSEDNKS